MIFYFLSLTFSSFFALAQWKQFCETYIANVLGQREFDPPQ